MEVCNTNTGALTMGFWKNPNGQGIISSANQGNLGTWLRQFHPFTNAPSTGLASYVSGIIGAAKCTSSDNTCNLMLRAQMLATALDVYFSDPALGGNKIGAYTGLGGSQPAIGGININLKNICPASDGGLSGSCGEDASGVFGNPPPAACRTVAYMLSDQNLSYADPAADNGANWYGQVKAKQVLAKDAFDAINNKTALICP